MYLDGWKPVQIDIQRGNEFHGYLPRLMPFTAIMETLRAFVKEGYTATIVWVRWV